MLGLVSHKDKRYVCPDCKDVGIDGIIISYLTTIHYDEFSGMGQTGKESSSQVVTEFHMKQKRNLSSGTLDFPRTTIIEVLS